MIRLLVADDHRMFRQGLTRLLADQEGMEVIAEAATSAEVLDALRVHTIDLAVLDLSMPGRGGVDLITRVKSLKPRTRILVVTMYGDDPYVTQALRAGADGYMTKENAAEDLVRAIRRVAYGGRYLCPSVAEGLATGIATRTEGNAAHASLSVREYKIFEMLVSGKRGSEIADELALSEKTVSTHKAHLLRKMKLTNRTELVVYAIKHQLVAV
jgi:DNA-binding NarL/FixJ family response regulator